MTDLDWMGPEPDDRYREVKCRHPRFLRSKVEGVESCSCGHTFDPAKQRQGRLNRQRGNAKERRSAEAHGTRRTGHHGGKDDYRTALFAFQNKSAVPSRFPGWMSTELDALRMAWPNLEPVLHVEESPGPGKRARHLYVVDRKTWLALHREEVSHD